MTPCLSSAVSLRESENVPSAKHYRVINECPESIGSKTLNLKCDGTDRAVLEDFIWVSDQKSGNIFQNKHCSKCHGVDDVEIWTFEARCQTGFGFKFDNLKDDLIYNGCYMVNIPPKYSENVVSQYECFEHLKKKVDSYFSCNQTGQ